MSDPLPNFAGHLVDEGRLQLLEAIGTGTYGIVYKALETTPGLSEFPIHCAVKCLGYEYPYWIAEAKQQEREVALHTKVSHHPHIIHYDRDFFYGGCRFLVMELSEGGHLFDAIQTGIYRGNSALVKRVFLEIVDAVLFCHRRRVFHRDLKPENIMCDAEGTYARITDFGLAIQETCVCNKKGCGSPAYMTPESIAVGNGTYSYEPRQSDTWALCVILLNMMSGLYPWRKADESDRGWIAFQNDADYLQSVFPISDELNHLLLRAFKMDPDRRPTLSEIRTELISMPNLFMSPKRLARAPHCTRLTVDSSAVASTSNSAPSVNRSAEKAASVIEPSERLSQVSSSPPTSEAGPPESDTDTDNSSYALPSTTSTTIDSAASSSYFSAMPLPSAHSSNNCGASKLSPSSKAGPNFFKRVVRWLKVRW
ncbi:kinase-like domain-containing protein [Mycena rebaudengoi]|nr:kinase-like domain-containing protein [Mycena rebaudengoi]